MHRRSFLPLTLLLALLPGAAPAASADWPHVRGPETRGAAGDAPGTFGERIGLRPQWRVPLGSGYSGIAVAGKRAVTMFSEGDADWVAAFDTASGERLWRFRLGDRHTGMDGSDDGPLSSPTIAAGRVFALAPGGRLVALSLADGKLAWGRDLASDLGAKPPHFGFTSTPLVAADVLVVEAGGSQGRSIVGLEVANGELRWSHGDGSVDYQSPSLMTLAGREQVVTWTSTALTGIAPEDGAILWTRDLGEDDRSSSANPTFIGDDRFIVLMGGDATAYRVGRSAGGFAVEESYRTNALGGSYAQPVYHDGHIYGFRGKVLTCVRAVDGVRLWRSRPPGGEGLIVVDGHLVIFAPGGNVVVAEASPEGYRELARVQALDGSGLTWPSFAGGRIFLRNLEEMAAVSVTDEAATQVTGHAAGKHALARWLAELDRTTDRKAFVDELMARHETLPWIDGEHVHFLWRGDAEDVAISGGMLQSESAEPMHRVAGTDLFYRTFRLEPQTRWEYGFHVDYDTFAADPRNPRRVPDAESDDEHSELLLPGYVEPKHQREPAATTAGRIEEFTLAGKTLGYDKRVRVWIPRGHGEDGRTFPLVVVQDGFAWLDKGRLDRSLGHLAGNTVAAPVVAFVERSPRWWLEAGGTRTDDFVAMLANELLPALRERYRVDAGPAAMLGSRYYGFSSIYAAVKHPGSFDRVAVQSLYFGLGAEHELERMVRAGRGAPELRVHIDWNRWDDRNVDRAYDFAADSKRLKSLLEEHGYNVTGGEVLDSRGWGGSRNRADRALQALLPAP